MVPGPDPEHSAEDIIEIFVQSPEPAFVASEIAESLDASTQGARNRLERLVEQGHLAKKSPGARTTMYWLTPQGHRYYATQSDDGDGNDAAP
jgi:predicted ArsR family transcriptional regulator